MSSAAWPVTAVGPGLSATRRGTIDVVPPSLSSTHMVGRGTQLDDLRSALATAADGTATTVLVAGDAGVGKTRLVEEFAEGARASGARVVVGRSVELGSDGLPYRPVAGALRDLTTQLGPDTMLDLAGPARGSLLSLLPELGEHEGGPSEGQGRLFDVVTLLLERAAADQPLVVVIEDLHWADRSTRDLLRFAIRALGDAAVLLILTYRSDELHRTHPLRPFLAELDRLWSVRRTLVPPLSRAEVQQQLLNIGGAEVSSDDLDRIYGRSQGIPFFVEELAAAEDDPSTALPDSLRDLLLVRAESLSDESQRLLRVVSTGGNRVDHSLLAAVSELDSADLDRALRESVSGNLLTVDGDGYAFRHALLREAIHGDMLPGEHARHHVRYAEQLEADPGLVSSRSVTTEIAHHWYSAHRQQEAFSSALVAAADSRRAFAYAEAQRMYERALELWESVDDPAGLAGSDHGAVLSLAADAATDAGDVDRSLALVDAALAEPAVRSDPARTLALTYRKAGGHQATGRPSADLLRHCLELLDQGDASIRARVKSMVLSEEMVAGRFANVLELYDETLAAAQEAGEAWVVRKVHRVAGPSLVHLGRVDDGLAEFEKSKLLAGDNPQDLVGYHINLSDSLYLMGRYADAAAVAQAGIDVTARAGWARSLGAMMAGNAAEPLLALGEWDRAEALIARGLQLEPPMRHVWQLLMLRGQLALWRGDTERARTFLSANQERMSGRAPGSQYAIPGTRLDAELALADDDLETAWAEVSAALVEASLIPAYHLPTVATAAAILNARVAVEGLEAVRPDAEWMRQILAVLRGWPASAVWVRLTEAELDSLDGNAVDSWRLALDTLARAEGPAYLRCYSGYRLGESLVAAGDRAGAVPVLRSAAEAADRLGARGLRGRIGDLSERARPPHPGRRPRAWPRCWRRARLRSWC